MSAPEPVRWSVVVPVKRLDQAKSRLSARAGAHREDLALALAHDTVEATLACPLVCRVVVVTDDPRVAGAVGRPRVLVVPDLPDRGLNPALEHGAGRATQDAPGHGVVALAADLPALRAAELSVALGEAAAHPTAFVADAEGTGTTLLTARPGVSLRPRFGRDSRARHLAAGAVELAVAGVTSVRRDVDTEEDLDEALRMGAGPRTVGVARRLGALP
jgi:2-phospho-L-lactate guanylyltransferase